MTPEQLKDATEGCTTERDIAVRQVQRGYVINGTVRYLDGVTRAIRLAQQSETVVVNANDVGHVVETFMLNGTFE